MNDSAFTNLAGKTPTSCRCSPTCQSKRQGWKHSKGAEITKIVRQAFPYRKASHRYVDVRPYIARSLHCLSLEKASQELYHLPDESRDRHAAPLILLDMLGCFEVPVVVISRNNTLVVLFAMQCSLADAAWRAHS